MLCWLMTFIFASLLIILQRMSLWLLALALGLLLALNVIFPLLAPSCGLAPRKILVVPLSTVNLLIFFFSGANYVRESR